MGRVRGLELDEFPITLYLEVTEENPELGDAVLTLTAKKVGDEERPPPLRLVRTRVTLPSRDPTHPPERTCRIVSDPRTRQELADAATRVTAAAEAALDQRAYVVIAQGAITNVRMLRHLLAVKTDAAEGAIARLLQAGRVRRPARQRDPYTVVDGSGCP